jgi:hypothetical protein
MPKIDKRLPRKPVRSGVPQSAPLPRKAPANRRKLYADEDEGEATPKTKRDKAWLGNQDKLMKQVKVAADLLLSQGYVVIPCDPKLLNDLADATGVMLLATVKQSQRVENDEYLVMVQVWSLMVKPGMERAAFDAFVVEQWRVGAITQSARDAALESGEIGEYRSRRI